ncbi:alpha/beta hydrolase family protein [Paraglaciecola hydrolytica]|uniref:Peptidase S9 prolyl oligopeptidase catalytic domain-containing protein n=1 Tax=Paraglaciecola hydrolytica TaxID=1799789 RepID=A0A136A6W3_9ALTE|nr:hypothetical protein [Paraglaciecola hydrolytica]KXI30978.1 hypothetical protein AX660_00510 [Paraglaciecola hydrolytica]
MSNLAITATIKISIKFIFIYILLLYFGRGDLVLAATVEPKLNEIEVQKTCLGQFTDYDNWVDSLREKNGYIKTFFLKLKYSRAAYNDVKNQLDCDVIHYTSKGVTISGYIVVPKNSKQQKIPVLIYNNGNNQHLGSITFSHMFNNIFPLANKGYIVLASQYRGTFHESKGVKDANEKFGDDVNYMLALLDLINTLPMADTANVTISGGHRRNFIAM